MRRTKVLLSGVGVAALALAAPSWALAAVTIGSTFTPTVECGATRTFVQSSTLGGNSYAAPSDGVITSWAHHADLANQSFRFKVVRPLGGNSFSLVGESVLTPLTPGVLNEFPIRISVKTGDIIGFYRSGMLPYDCAKFTEWVDDLVHSIQADIAGGTTVFPEHVGGLILDISARLEADADRDGFGDDTQDQCPTDASTQGTCPLSPPSPVPPSLLADTDPPETKITKRPPNETQKTTVKLKFRSDEQGSRFECKVDRKPWKACFSPKTVNGLTEGKHKFSVRAVDAAKNIDASPAKDGFKVVSFGT